LINPRKSISSNISLRKKTAQSTEGRMRTHTHIHTRVHILGGSSSFSVLDEEMLLAVKQVIKKAFCNS